MQKVPENIDSDSRDEASDGDNKGERFVKTFSGPQRAFGGQHNVFNGVLVEEGPKLPYQEYLDKRAEFNKLFRQ